MDKTSSTYSKLDRTQTVHTTCPRRVIKLLKKSNGLSAKPEDNKNKKMYKQINSKKNYSIDFLKTLLKYNIYSS